MKPKPRSVTFVMLLSILIGQRPPDFETRIQYARALMRLAAEDYETDRIVFEVRALLKPQSALREPELASRVMSMMAVA